MDNVSKGFLVALALAIAGYLAATAYTMFQLDAALTQLMSACV